MSPRPSRSHSNRDVRRRFRVGRLLATGVVATVAASSLTAVAEAGPAAPTVPTRIQVDAGNKVFLVGHAVGVQIYRCDGSVWSASTPRADLYDDNGKQIATHYAGPTWQATDGSKVVGRRVDGVTVDPSAIPWLLLAADSKSAGPDGARLAETTFIQRIATTGGLVPPAADCNAEAQGTVAEVPYTADYYFWKAK
jgi:Protein of unknown function (DUF3455)